MSSVEKDAAMAGANEQTPVVEVDTAVAADVAVADPAPSPVATDPAPSPVAPSRPRNPGFDLARVVAMCMVVGVHAIPATTGALGPWYDAAMQVLLFPANVIFFMLSGRLNLRVVSDEKLPSYYYRKFVGILLPVLVYFLIRTVWDLWPIAGVEQLPFVLKCYVLNTLGDFVGTEYWFVFQLLGMLLVAPIVAPAFVDMSAGRKRAFVVLFLLFCTPALILSRSAHSFAWPLPLGGWFCCFLLGAALDLDRLVVLPSWKVALPTFACMLVSVLLLHAGFPHHPVNDSSPLYYLAGAGMLVLLYGLGSRLGTHGGGVKGAKGLPALQWMARHSFGVYLIHLPLMRVLQPLMPSLPYPLAHLALTVLTAVAAFVCAAVIDALLVGPLQKAANLAWKRLSAH